MNTNIPAVLQVQDIRDVTIAASDDLTTLTAHGFVAGDAVVYPTLVGGTGLTAGTTYYVLGSNITANVFEVSATFGGSKVNVTVDATTGSKVQRLLSWGRAKTLFTREDRAWLAKYYQAENDAALADGGIFDTAKVCNFFISRALPK